MDVGLSRAELAERLFDVPQANQMHDGVHIRLMVTRGVKRTPYQDPRVTIGPATIVIIPEYKLPKPEVVERGITLFTVHVRRTGPAEQDQKLNSHSKLNCILACIQATKAGADEALMLDPLGFVATCNSTHFFIVRKGELWTSPPEYCLGGITRAQHAEGRARSRHPGLREAFLALPMSMAPTRRSSPAPLPASCRSKVDGREIGNGDAQARPLMQRLRAAYKALAMRSLTPLGATA